MRINREQAQQELRRGRAVSFNGRELRKEKQLPGKDAEGVYVALRSQDGTLSRAGMEHVIAQGGSVLHGDTVIDKADDLPPEEVLAAGNAERLRLAVAAHDSQLAEIMAQKQRTERALQAAEEAAKRRAEEPEPEKGEAKHAAHGHGQHAAHAKARQKE